MELHGLALQQFFGFASRHVSGAAKQQMHGRQFFLGAPSQHRLQQQLPRGRINGQQTRTRHGCEGDSNQSLGVVGQSVLLIGVGPGPVKHVLAVRMFFQIHRACGHQCIAQPQGDEARRPAAVGRGAATLVHGLQVSVLHEGGGAVLLRQQLVPCGGGNLCGVRVHLNAIIVQLFLHFIHDASTQCSPAQFHRR